eukprot:CAMPEP_0204641204 /NCGR_PEP_ID=MMETSP0717-20131115/50370_1 /ASSEMBLY_ACC=CAM_ASM_000666 /TAXON_ID=230516 /ORGANISM="Chaetoceros curvisetus" /LENGTH=38 /DNA_ID= /DNA_START= /DNA_END= /DNA_ORIENTATION=
MNLRPNRTTDFSHMFQTTDYKSQAAAALDPDALNSVHR